MRNKGITYLEDGFIRSSFTCCMKLVKGWEQTPITVISYSGIYVPRMDFIHAIATRTGMDCVRHKELQKSVSLFALTKMSFASPCLLLGLCWLNHIALCGH